ncbi:MULTISPECIES: GpE family phage tail protein [Snodgrassella]|uniref:GpE family phage tail protein n=1 Tax=Snodgrassella TaxID=1193515 RepID=UPI000C1F5852|nr:MULTISPECIES: GpE family phage tail protein [Snodgrassella]NUE66724.1 GpE family phage tail protein [Snodgrassella sp. ESL0253]
MNCRGRTTRWCVSFVWVLTDWDGFYQAAADLAWWFGFSPADIDEMSLDEILQWQQQANRQIKAKYSKL